LFGVVSFSTGARKIVLKNVELKLPTYHDLTFGSVETDDGC